MSEDKKTTKTVAKAAKADEVEIVERSPEELDTGQVEEKREPELKDGVYTEYGVELLNGRLVDVEVAVSRSKRPPEYSLMMAQGFGSAALQILLSMRTRYALNHSGWSDDDLEQVIAPVIQRGLEASGEVK